MQHVEAASKDDKVQSCSSVCKPRARQQSGRVIKDCTDIKRADNQVEMKSKMKTGSEQKSRSLHRPKLKGMALIFWLIAACMAAHMSSRDVEGQPQMPFVMHPGASLLGPGQVPNEQVFAQPAPPSLPAPPFIQVPGSMREQEGPVTRIVWPDELLGPASASAGGQTKQGGGETTGGLKVSTSSASPEPDLSVSYVIDSKRFVEAVPTRCFASTILEDPKAVEPEFVIIKPTHEIRLNATTSLEHIMQAGFEPNKKTTIFVHGFTQSYPNTTWLRRSRALFEINHHVVRQNLIIMDWGRASKGPFSHAAAVVSGMGSFLANFIMKLTDLGADRMSIHIVGHSLGAHVAGFAGKRLKPRIGRITALDAAGPCFGKIFSNGPNDRLSHDDAYEVAVYHYDDDFLGLPGQHGQFDVYVNGGSSQPGCENNVNAMFQAMITMIFRRNRVLSESHTRSTEVSTVPLARTGCQMVAYECRDYPSFQAGECGKCDDQNSQCFYMGFDFQYSNNDDQQASLGLRTSFPGKRLYISTGATETYCMHHYQVLVKFEPHPDMRNAAKRDKWRITLELADDSGGLASVQLTNQVAPNVFSALLLTDARPARFKAARLQVKTSDGSLVNVQKSLGSKDLSSATNSKLTSHRIFAVEINFMSNVNPNIRRLLSSHLCPVAGFAGLPPTAWRQLPPGSSDQVNAIGDSTPVARVDWLEFEECLPRFG